MRKEVFCEPAGGKKSEAKKRKKEVTGKPGKTGGL